MKGSLRIIVTLSLVLFTLISSVSIALADEVSGIVDIQTIEISQGFYKIDFKLKDIDDLAGLSIDMQYDHLIYDLTDSQGNPVNQPVYIDQSIYTQGVPLTAINKVSGNQITYVSMLVGVNMGQGSSFSDFTTFATLYMKCKEGQVGTPNYTATVDREAIDLQTACVKLSNSGAVMILYLDELEEQSLHLTLDDRNGTLVDGTYTLNVILEAGNNQMEHNLQVVIANHQGEVDIPIETSWTGELVMDMKIVGYSIASQAMDLPIQNTELPVDLYAGELSGDRMINDADFQLFFQMYKEDAMNSPFDYNRDGIFDLRDLYYLSINDGKGGFE